MAKTLKLDLNRIADYRHQLGTNQQTFWQSLGVTQSGGSRYETGRTIPLPVAILLVLRETNKITNEELRAATEIVKKARGKR